MTAVTRSSGVSMATLLLLTLLASFVAAIAVSKAGDFEYDTKEECQKFLDKFNDEAEDNWYKDNVMAWKYQTNITDYNQKKMVSHHRSCRENLIAKNMKTFFTKNNSFKKSIL